VIPEHALLKHTQRATRPTIFLRCLTLLAGCVFLSLHGACIAEDTQNEDFDAATSRMLSLRSQGRFAEAIPFARQATEHLIRAKGEISEEVAVARLMEGHLHEKLNDLEQAAANYRKAFAIVSKLDKGNTATAKVLLTIGRFFRANDQLDDAIASLRLGVAIQNELAAKDDSLLAETLHALTFSYLDQSNHAKAVGVMEKLVVLTEKLDGPQSSHLAGLLAILGNVHHKLHQLEAARRHYERALTIHNNTLFLFQDADALSFARSGLGDVLFDIGNYAESESLYRKELAACERTNGQQHADCIALCRKIAMCLVFRDKLRQSEQFAERAANTAEKALGENNQVTAASLDTLASIYRIQGKWDDAKALYDKSVRIAEEKHGPNHRETATGLLNTASFYAEREDFKQAAALTERALAIYKAQQPLDVMDIAIASQNLGMTYWGLGRHQEAQDLLTAATEACTKTLGPNHLNTISIQHSRAQNLFFLGKNEDVHRIAADCLERIEDTLGGDHTAAISPRVTVAVNHVVISDRGTAAKAFDTSLRHLVSHISKHLPGLSASEQLAVLKAGPSRPYHAALTFAVMRPDDTLTAELSAAWLANMKSLGHEALASASVLQKQLPNAADQDKLRALADVRQQLARLTQMVPADSEEAAYQEDCRRLEKAERDLVHEIGGQLAELYRYAGWTEVKDIQTHMPSNSVLIDFARVRPFDFNARAWPASWQPERYAAWLIPAEATGRVSVVDLGPADEIDRLVAEYQKELRISLGPQGAIATHGEKAAEESARQKGKLLAKAVFTPLAKAVREKCGLTDVSTLVICPDSALWLIPWAALPLDDSQYLVEKHAVLTVTSARELTRERNSRTSQTPPVVFADPDFDVAASQPSKPKRPSKAASERETDVLKQVRRIPRAARLPATREEATLLQPVFASLTGSKPVTHIGPDATETAVKSLRGPRIAHFATHGFFLDDSRSVTKGSELAALSAGGTRASNPLRGVTGDQLRSPFLRSGLLLAGCNSGTPDGITDLDDGVLTGAEVLGIDLMGTDLAVLSACETAVGDTHCGEGVAGLRQAFLIAGADSVLASLWHVDDKATVDLMTGFFDRLDTGKSPADALAIAQRAALKERRRSHGAAHPVYWAAFELTQ
jgi:CHAT domain-containing protein/tetratricopeptide (TPR) repeat protein